MTKPARMPIGEVAGLVGTSVRTLRYYEEVGLLESAERGPGGVRYYTEAEVQRVKRILDLRNTRGFTLEEVREYLAAEEGLDAIKTSYSQSDTGAKLQIIDKAEELLQRELKVVEAKLQGLTDMQRQIIQRLERIRSLRQELGGPKQG